MCTSKKKRKLRSKTPEKVVLGPCSSWELASYVLDAENFQCEYA